MEKIVYIHTLLGQGIRNIHEKIMIRSRRLAVVGETDRLMYKIPNACPKTETSLHSDICCLNKVLFKFL